MQPANIVGGSTVLRDSVGMGAFKASSRASELSDVCEWRRRDPFEHAQSITYPKGTVLFEQGSILREVFLLEQGLVKNLWHKDDGGAVIVWLCDSPGIYLGATCAIVGKVNITAALVTSCRLKRIPASQFVEAVSSDAALSWALHQSHCKIMEHIVNKLVQFGSRSVRERLEILLWQLVKALQTGDHGEEHVVRLTMPLKRREIADLLAVSPEHLSRVISQMESDGVLRRDKGRIIVLQPARLRRDDC